MNDNQLPHAKVLHHMADYGFESVEYEAGTNADGNPINFDAKERRNPLTSPELPWRIKPVVTPLHIDDFPMPETEAPAAETRYYALFIFDSSPYRWNGDSHDARFLNSGRVYLDADKRDKANKLLIAALTRKGSGECSGDGAMGD